MDSKGASLELKEKAERVSACIAETISSFDRFVEIVSGSDYYWEGEAGSYYRTLYAEEMNEMEEILKRLKNCPGEILQAAGLSLEEETNSGREALPGDILS